MLLTVISRPPLYLFAHHYFLLSSKTLYEVLSMGAPRTLASIWQSLSGWTDLFAYGAAAWAISQLQPRKPTFRRQPIHFLRSLSSASLQSAGLAIVLGTLVSALVLFVTDRLGLQGVIRRGVEERAVPAFLAPSRYNFAFANRHPTLPVPIIRSDLTGLSMRQALMYSAPLSVRVSQLLRRS